MADRKDALIRALIMALLRCRNKYVGMLIPSIECVRPSAFEKVRLLVAGQIMGLSETPETD